MRGQTKVTESFDGASRNLIQVVPGLFPRVDGIGDYALQLARRLRERHGVNSFFLVADPNWQGGEVEGFYATKIVARTSLEFLNGVVRCEESADSKSLPILLHFSPYSYQKRGYPLWLQRTLEGWDEQQPSTLNIVFHELEVHGAPPWSSAFWVPPFQRHLIRKIAKLGYFQYTNAEFHRHDLEEWGSGRIFLIPNFSTMGEPATNPPFSERRKDVVVFGRSAQRKANYERGSDVLASLCRSIGAQRIIDIGDPIAGDARTDIAGVPVVRCGRLESHEVNEWMARSVASFIAYPIPLLPKSSVHAVSCAHGTIPFVFDNQKKEFSCPGLISGLDYIALSRQHVLPEFPSLERLSESVFASYQNRSSSSAADQIAKYLFSSSIRC